MTDPASPAGPTGGSSLSKRRLVDGSLILLAAFSGVSGLCSYLFRGEDAFWASLRGDLELMIGVLPTLVPSIMVAAFLQVLTPASTIRRHLGAEAGPRALFTALPLGVIVPGGPIVSMPMLQAMMTMGVELAACATFYLSWGLLGFTRIVVWEIPLMGMQFATLRFLTSLCLPLVGGLAAAWVFRRLARRGDTAS